ncbi:MAG: CAP domain-containing protein, partial [Clostridiales Family XIII bacterium]|nr:CAP domain-containing protein [Clostridiales Family XIII bacterium]
MTRKIFKRTTISYHKPVAFIITCALLFTTLPTLAFGSTEPASEKAVITLDESIKYDAAWKALDLVNAERAKDGRSPLSMDSGLLKAAVTRAGEIALLFGHTRPDGSDWSTTPELHKNAHIAENLAAGQPDPAAVVTGAHGWVNSAPHYKTLMDSKYKSTGIACIEIGGNKWWVQVFSSNEADSVSKPANKNAQAKVSALTDNLNVSIVISPKVAITGNTVGYSVVNR